jgi:hypothetical protein
MTRILFGVLSSVRGAHQFQDLIIVVLPVCPVQAQSRRYFGVFARDKCRIGFTGLTSGVKSAGLERLLMGEKMFQA